MPMTLMGEKMNTMNMSCFNNKIFQIIKMFNVEEVHRQQHSYSIHEFMHNRGEAENFNNYCAQYIEYYDGQ